MLAKFENLRLVSRLMSILQSQGLSNKTLAEFVLSLCKQHSADLHSFRQALKNNGADFEDIAV